MIRGAGVMLLLGLLAGSEAPTPEAPAPRAAPVCRCAQRNLEAYYAEAEEVVLARLVRWEDGTDDRRFHMRLASPPWKTSDRRGKTIDVGEVIEYVTVLSTAGCGLQPTEGAVYVMFAFPDPETDDGLRVDTCSGSRIFVETDGGPPQGFTDVPGRFVPSQLDALSGMAFLRAVADAAPDGSDPGNETLVGLLDLKALAHGGTVPVRVGPDPASGAVTTVRSYQDVASREVAYEVPAAVVVARADGWYRVRLAREGLDVEAAYGWVGPDDAGTWFPYADLPVRRLNYLTGAWSGHVWPEAGAGIPSRGVPAGSGDGRAEYPAQVHEGMMVGGMPWFRVDVLAGDPCEGSDVRVERSGWVPGYGAGGEPVVWFYSRGC